MRLLPNLLIFLTYSGRTLNHGPRKQFCVAKPSWGQFVRKLSIASLGDWPLPPSAAAARARPEPVFPDILPRVPDPPPKSDPTHASNFTNKTRL
jgi:hypothetical protein